MWQKSYARDKDICFPTNKTRPSVTAGAFHQFHLRQNHVFETFLLSYAYLMYETFLRANKLIFYIGAIVGCLPEL